MSRHLYPLCLCGVFAALGVIVWMNGSTKSADAVPVSRRFGHYGDRGNICTCGGGNVVGRFMLWVLGMRASMLEMERDFQWRTLPDHKGYALLLGAVMLRRQRRSTRAA